MKSIESAVIGINIKIGEILLLAGAQEQELQRLKTELSARTSIAGDQAREIERLKGMVAHRDRLLAIQAEKIKTEQLAGKMPAVPGEEVVCRS